MVGDEMVGGEMVGGEAGGVEANDCMVAGVADCLFGFEGVVVGDGKNGGGKGFLASDLPKVEGVIAGDAGHAQQESCISGVNGTVAMKYIGLVFPADARHFRWKKEQALYIPKRSEEVVAKTGVG